MRLFEAFAGNLLNTVMPGFVHVTFNTEADITIYGRIRGTESTKGTEWEAYNLRRGTCIRLDPGILAVFRTETGRYLNVNGKVSSTGVETASITLGRTSVWKVQKKSPIWKGSLDGIPVSVELKKESEQP